MRLRDRTRFIVLNGDGCALFTAGATVASTRRGRRLRNRPPMTSARIAVEEERQDALLRRTLRAAVGCSASFKRGAARVRVPLCLLDDITAARVVPSFF